MRKVLIMAVCLLIVCAFTATAYAGEYEKSCDEGWWSKVANECVTHPTSKRRNEVGAGVDVIRHESKDGEILNKVTGEYKYDWQNGEHKSYVVATTKLEDIWAKVKSIFNKDDE
jgi:uncharacterized protein YcnI